ncbi:MAG: response regulator [Deltaproteobacteria bacterium]|nr:response regulator [Deltaproteobacteria bacterium]
MPFRLLVIDDEMDMLVLLRLILSEQKRYELVTTPNPWEVENILQDQEIHLVITDWRMPGRSGLEVLEAVHRRDPDLPVILITAYDSPESAAEAGKKGAFDYLPKPFRKDRLLAAVEKGLAVYREKKKLQP